MEAGEKSNIVSDSPMPDGEENAEKPVLSLEALEPGMKENDVKQEEAEEQTLPGRLLRALAERFEGVTGERESWHVTAELHIHRWIGASAKHRPPLQGFLHA
jgi:hypothetical protein